MVNRGHLLRTALRAAAVRDRGNQDDLLADQELRVPLPSNHSTNQSTVPAPASAKDFIKRVLVLDPKLRMTIDEMCEHPFLK
jgi:hypothetical protein